MSLRARFALLIVALVAGLLLAVGLLHRAERQERAVAVAAAQAEAEAGWQGLLELQSEAFQRFIGDYSWWDEMFDFIDHRDPEWARINLNEALPFHALSAIWVTDPAGKLVYRALPEGAQPPASLPPAAALLAIARRAPFAHWFELGPAGLVELRLAPIQPSVDIARQTVPRGWLLAARTWDQPQLDRLTAIFGGTITVTTPMASTPAPGLDTITVRRLVHDASGQPVATLQLTRPSPYLEAFSLADTTESTIFVGFGVALLVAVILALQIWIVRPLGAISEALRSREPAPTKALLNQRDEIGGIAREVASSFAREHELQIEIQRRRELADSLRQNEIALREAIAERVLLGRNLHDSVIQTIYAAGLGLAATKTLLRSDPTGAEHRLEQVRVTLNDTIRELRAYITQLEPEALPHMTFETAVSQLLAALLPEGTLRPTFDLDESVAARLPAGARAHSLQILREAVSNARRHGQATSLSVGLHERDGVAELIITDNGGGFDPEVPPATGRGLANMKGRIRDLGGRLDIQSQPDNGTRIRVTLPIPEPIS